MSTLALAPAFNPVLNGVFAAVSGLRMPATRRLDADEGWAAALREVAAVAALMRGARALLEALSGRVAEAELDATDQILERMTLKLGQMATQARRMSVRLERAGARPTSRVAARQVVAAVDDLRLSLRDLKDEFVRYDLRTGEPIGPAYTDMAALKADLLRRAA